MKMRAKITMGSVVVATAALLLTLVQHADATPVWFDGYDVSEAGGTSDGTSSFNINTELGAPRQGGALVPTAYVTNTPDPTNDYHHQLFPPSNGVQPLQLAGDAGLVAPPPIFAFPTLVSPDHNFTGTLGGEIVGKRITFDLDVATFTAGNPNDAFIQAGVSIGASSALVIDDEAVPHFGVKFIEDTLGGAGNGPFLQFYEGDTLVQNLIANPAGFGPFTVQLDINDLADGDPWDGVGSTTISVSINGSPVGAPHTIGGGGLLDNYITFQGDRDFLSNQLATHLFDNLTVHALPIPEPAAAGLLGIALGGLAAVGLRRR